MTKPKNNDKTQEIIKHNQRIWDREALAQNAWSTPVNADVISQAKKGNWQIFLTKNPLPESYLPKDVTGLKILCLACGGGQQAPVLSAAGADVTVADISKQQLEQDRYVARRDDLSLKTIQADMQNLSIFEKDYFDYVIIPISNLYLPDLTSLWHECHRVVKNNGILLACFYNPILFVFERNKALEEQGLLKPENNLLSMTSQQHRKKHQNNEAITFGHSLMSQINGQIEAGFLISGFYEDEHPAARFLIEQYMPTMIVTKAIKTKIPT
jgi:ubiquinone/menaquinone biosynthesis C-methylase UbiE